MRVSKLNRTVYTLANIQRSVRAVFVPPLYECEIVGSLVADFPIKLWHTVVHPTVVYPQQHVGVKFIIVLQTEGLATIRIVAFVTVDAKRRHAELHPGLQAVDVLAQLFNEHVDIVATPIVYVFDAIAVGTELLLVRNFHSCCGIRIEIVVDMESVNIVTTNDVFHHLVYIFAISRKTRIHNVLSVILEHACGVCHDDVAV